MTLDLRLDEVRARARAGISLKLESDAAWQGAIPLFCLYHVLVVVSKNAGLFRC
jgi:hypothetical protein